MFDSEELQNECSHRSDWRKGRLGKFQTRTWKVSCWIKASVLRHSSGWMSVCHLTLQLRHVFGQLSQEGLRKAGEQSGRQLLLPVLFVLHLQGQQNCFYVLLFSFTFIENVNWVVKRHSGFESGELLDTQKRACLWGERTGSGSRRAPSCHHSHPEMNDVVCIKLLKYFFTLNNCGLTVLF